jgi:hypothetical protein
MAKQKSPLIKLKGSIDDLTFYRTQDGHLAKEKRGIEADRLRSDPAFHNTRMAMAEFGSAGQSARLFRQAWIDELAIASDSRVIGRSVKVMMKVLKSDTVNRKGSRKAALGDFSFLERFEFNIAAPLAACLRKDPSIGFNRVTGDAVINIPALVPVNFIAKPDMATHYRFFAVASAIDFGTGDVTTIRGSSVEIPWNASEAPAEAMRLTLPANSTATVLVALGIQYTAQTNGFTDAVAKNANAFKLMLVSQP